MNSIKILLFISLFTCIQTVFSQNNHTIKYTEDMPPTKASLKDISWIEGHWRGEAFGGIAEEIWSPPLGGSMMFSFKLVKDDKVSFYELGYIKEVQESLILELKHFDKNLKGWEDKDKSVNYKLVRMEPDKVFFDQLTFEKISENEMHVYVVVGHDDTTESEIKFNYKRFRN